MLFYIGCQTLYGVVYQHSNARPHTASRTTQFSTYTNIQILSGLLCPPDLNPTEHIREDLDRCVQGRVNTHANTRESFHTLRQEWAAIPAQVIHNLIQTVPERCWAVIDSREDTPPTDGNATQSQNTEWLNLFMDEECYQFKKKYELDF